MPGFALPKGAGFQTLPFAELNQNVVVPKVSKSAPLDNAILEMALKEEEESAESEHSTGVASSSTQSNHNSNRYQNEPYTSVMQFLCQ